MEWQHLRCVLAVAEELHFARAAERLHIDQSPLSRTIRELEEDLGAPLFARTMRSTRLTRAGKLFLEHVLRVFAVLEQARASVQAAAAGYHGQLRIALSDVVAPARLSTLMRCAGKKTRISPSVSAKCRCRSRSRDCTKTCTMWGSRSRPRWVTASWPIRPGATRCMWSCRRGIRCWRTSASRSKKASRS
jgi:Bacterial regulatory helix-turn-helix protein, lysR family